MLVRQAEANCVSGSRVASMGVWRNGSASDSRSEGWEFESLCPHFYLGLSNCATDRRLEHPGHPLHTQMLPRSPGLSSMIWQIAPLFQTIRLPDMQSEHCLHVLLDPSQLNHKSTRGGVGGGATQLLQCGRHAISDTVSERLRRWTRNPLGSARRGSNPLAVVL